jgi:mRNA-degrading endonuclease RelE of RelBE toxin-antitoxin system
MYVAYAIDYSEQAQEDLAALRGFDRATIMDAISANLKYEPTVETRNRKRLERVLPAGMLDTAQGNEVWELRVGDFRVYYDVEPETKVLVIRVVEKGRLTTEGSLK